MPTDLNINQYKTLEYTGLTAGNGQIVAVPDRATDIVLTYIPTSAGVASIKYAVRAETPADFTDMPKTILGDFSTTGGQEVQAGVRWVGLDPASGTWTLRVSFKMT